MALNTLLILGCSFLSTPIFSATEISIRNGAPVLITPGIDVSRQTVITIALNSDQAYTVSINDDNSGTLRNGVATIPYRMSYNNNPEQTLSINPIVVESANSVVNGESTVAITILGSDTATAAAGDYTATLIITITGF